MLIEKSVEVVTVKVSALFNPKDDRSTRSRQAGLSLPAVLYRPKQLFSVGIPYQAICGS